MTIGIIPCAGRAERIHGLPKYLLPVGDSYLLAILVKRMYAAGVSHVYIGANRDNYDLVAQYAPDGCTVYLVNSKTMSETVLHARKYAGDHDVLFGMPDTYFESDTSLEVLYGYLETYSYNAYLGLFHVQPEQRSKLGMCLTHPYGYITYMEDKPIATPLEWAWGLMAWKSAFWAYIHTDDPHVGFAAQRSIANGDNVGGLLLGGRYYDCGTPAGYYRCIIDTVNEATASHTRQGVNE